MTIDSFKARVPAGHWLRLILLVALPVLVYANTLGNSYHLDDHYRIDGNTELERVWPPWRHFFDASTISTLPTLAQYRPLVPLSLTLDNRLSDVLGIDRLAGHHIGNIAIHVGTTVLLFFLLLRLLDFLGATTLTHGGRTGAAVNAAFSAALVFSVHPMTGVPVNYLSKRDQLLMGFFAVAALLAYLRFRSGARKAMPWLAVAILSLGLAMLSKEEGVAVILVVIFLEVLAPNRLWKGRPPLGTVLGLGLAAAALVLTVVSKAQWIWGRLSLGYGLTQLQVHLYEYLGQVIWPFRIRLLPRVDEVESVFEMRALAGLGFISATLLVAWFWRRRMPVVSFCILAYWSFLAPNSTFVWLRELAAPYRLYPGLAFVFLLGAVVLFSYLRPTAGYAVVAVTVLFFAGASFSLNQVWKDERSLWAHHVRFGGTATAHLNYGVSVWSSDFALAERHLRGALAQEPGNVYIHINLGLLMIETGRVEAGLTRVKRAVEVAPTLGIAHFWLADAYRRVGRLSEARISSVRAADLQPSNVEYQYQAARLLQELGDYAASIQYLRRVGRSAPEYADAAFLLGRALQETGQWNNAKAAYSSFLAAHPDHALTRFHLSRGLLAAGERDAALAGFREFIERGGGASPVWLVQYELAKYYKEIGDVEAAARHSSLAAEYSQTQEIQAQQD